FQAEDGIRDSSVTGVQTCALPIFCQDNAGGLEVRRSDGTWLKAPPIAGTWVVNVADMLSRWTNGRWQSTPHRVKNLSGGDRYSRSEERRVGKEWRDGEPT